MGLKKRRAGVVKSKETTAKLLIGKQFTCDNDPSNTTYSIVAESANNIRIEWEARGVKHDSIYIIEDVLKHINTGEWTLINPKNINEWKEYFNLKRSMSQ